MLVSGETGYCAFVNIANHVYLSCVNTMCRLRHITTTVNVGLRDFHFKCSTSDPLPYTASQSILDA